jgi:two-component system sensor histidine kinase DctS
VLLSVSLVALALIVLWSLWILRRHVLRRQAMEEQLQREHAFRKAMEDSLDTGMRARNLDGRSSTSTRPFAAWSAGRRRN